MNRNVWIAAALACAASSVVAAAPVDREITVTGCVENFSSTGISGKTERGFLLADAMPVADPVAASAASAPAPVGTSGVVAPGMPASGQSTATSGTMATPPRSKSAYRLESGDRDLKDDVGHKVEVSGVLVPRREGAPKSEEDRLQVTALRVIASECSK
jgi:uncharacterized protein YraI